MTEALDRLIEAVEAGDDAWIYQFEYSPSGIPKPGTIRAAYHGSLDADHALHEALLPGWEWRIRDNRAWVWRGVNMYESGEVEDDDFRGLPARAWLLAILRAYRAQIWGEG